MDIPPRSSLLAPRTFLLLPRSSCFDSFSSDPEAVLEYQPFPDRAGASEPDPILYVTGTAPPNRTRHCTWPLRVITGSALWLSCYVTRLWLAHVRHATRAAILSFVIMMDQVPLNIFYFASKFARALPLGLTQASAQRGCEAMWAHPKLILFRAAEPSC